MQKRRYTRLEDQERESISRGLAQHKSIRQMARELNRSPSTIPAFFGPEFADPTVQWLKHKLIEDLSLSSV
jgi:hypothetical protein